MNEPIRFEDLENVDFGSVIAERDLEPTSPGDILLHDFMEPLDLNASSLAQALAVPPNRITAILATTRGVTADSALRLARYFGTTAEFWMGLQASYDLKQAVQQRGRQISRQVRPRAA